jgi:hypothetical protein
MSGNKNSGILTLSEVMEKFDETFVGSPLVASSTGEDQDRSVNSEHVRASLSPLSSSPPAKPAAPTSGTERPSVGVAGEGMDMATYEIKEVGGYWRVMTVELCDYLTEAEARAAIRRYEQAYKRRTEEIEALKAEVDLWKDRCMWAERERDATLKYYNEMLDSRRGNW